MESTTIVSEMKITILLIIFFSCASKLNAEVGEGESLIEISDSELEDEIRRRWLGGLWSGEEALSLLNRAIDCIGGRKTTARETKFASEAQHLVELITGETSPEVDLTTDDVEDPDYVDESYEVGSVHTVTRKTMSLILDMIAGSNGQRRRSYESIEKLYPWFKPYMPARFKQRLAGSRRDKLTIINNEVLKRFKQVRNNRQPVHGRTIQKWARQLANATNLEDFKASDSWLFRFMRRNKIMSRKVTVYTSRSEEENREAVATSIRKFGETYKSESAPFERDNIFNFDQTGFNYEPTNLRTLSFKGERNTSLIVDSGHKTTHSYSVQPMISRNGKLFPKLLIVTQEVDNSFGPRIEPKIRELELKFGNIEV